MSLKKYIPNKRFIIKSILIIFILSIASTYVTSALAKQDRLTPDNPFQSDVNGFYSDIPLYGGNKELIQEKDEIDGEDEIDENKDENKDENNNQDEQNNSIEENKQTNESKQSKQKIEEENNDKGTHDRETNDKGTDKSTSENDGNLNKESSPSVDDNEESQHAEILDEEDSEDSEDINEYFTTSIKQGETVAKKAYAFKIQQLDHDYKVKDISVAVDSKAASVKNVNDSNKQQVNVNLKLAEGENKITVAVEYEQEDATFTVLREYIVTYDENSIIIETDLKEQEVTDETLEFTASAKQGEKQVPLTANVKQNGDQHKLKEKDKNQYIVELEEGDNEFLLVATSGNNELTETIHVYYNKPSPPDITIETTLSDYQDKVVKEPNLDFTAKAYDGEEEVNLNVTHKHNSLDSDDHSYNATLDEGENTFELKATKGDYTESISYTVYYEPEASGGAGEEDPSEDEPEISVFDISDGETIQNSIRTFHVKAKDYNGKSLTNTGNVLVTNNGESVEVEHADGEQVSFRLPITNGTNEIVISAEDSEGNKASKTLTIHGEVDEDGAPIGTATVSMEATTVGLGYLIPPQEVEIYQGERATYVLDRVLKEAGFTYTNTGTLDSSFYLAVAHKDGMAADVNVPEDLLETLEDNNVEVYLPHKDPNGLGEFDVTPQSGWMYSVNGVYANVGFADYYLKDGDELRIRFTLAYGNDIGLGENNFQKEW